MKPNAHAFQAIIFDMDGVLMHSSPIHEAAYRQALAAVPVAGFRYDSVAGMRTDEAMRRILGENGISASDSEIASLAAEKSRLARAWIAEQNPVDPDARATLQGLRAGYRLAMASSASKGTVDLFLNANSLRAFFECTLDGSDVHTAKPAPDLYLLCCRRLGVDPANCLIVEDAVNGIEAGKAAGATVWAVPSGSEPPQLLAAGADRVLGSLRELLSLVEAR